MTMVIHIFNMLSIKVLHIHYKPENSIWVLNMFYNRGVVILNSSSIYVLVEVDDAKLADKYIIPIGPVSNKSHNTSGMFSDYI